MRTCLSVEKASKSFGDVSLFEQISFSIPEGRKVALIAPNGSGKTTLLNILAGRDTFDRGSCYLNADLKFSYLEQDPGFDPQLTIFQVVYGAPGTLMETVRAYENAYRLHLEKDLEEAIALMDFHHAWDLDARIKQMLSLLRLDTGEQRVARLSGGQLKRLALAVALINEPDFLILDEPTNHLDLDMIEWLEAYLHNSSITLLMVTHDRYFLNRVCDQILELDERSLYLHTGNYADFLRTQSMRIANRSMMAEKAQNLLRSELEWMNRMPKARGTKAKYRIDAFYDLKEQASYRRDEKKILLTAYSRRLGKKILVLQDLCKRFDQTLILDHFTYTFSRGEKLGIIGKNGTGKTTFLELITGSLQPDSGRIDPGETVVYGYYKQEGLLFKPGERVIDILKDIAEVVTLGNGTQMTISQYLNRFLFPPEMHYVQVERLSGGEKRRLYLMTVLMKNPNFLILDEPTNDFDILTLNVLEELLISFGGCLIVVSHDRFFMDKIVDHLFIFEGDGIIYNFPGNYSEYRASQKKREVEVKGAEKATFNAVLSTAGKRKNSPTPGKLTFKEKKELDELTRQIERLEKEKENLEISLSSGSLEPDALYQTSSRLGEVLKEMDAMTDRWIELGEKEH